MFELSAPGKTFLLGEYYVMQAGEAFVINTAPRFHLSCEPATKTTQQGISPHSPAAKFIADNMAIFSDFKFKFIDPYNRLGGFGASTAQFLLVYKAKHLLLGITAELKKSELLQDYYRYSWNGQGMMPSGADLLAQMTGGLSYVNKKTLENTPQNWPFPDLDFHVIHTKNKLATHKHLKNLTEINTVNLQTAFMDCKQAVHSCDAALFCESVNQYHAELSKLKLVSDNSLGLIQSFAKTVNLLAAKGCGAMGADTLLLITDTNQKTAIKKVCAELNLIYIATNSSLSEGLKYEMVS